MKLLTASVVVLIIVCIVLVYSKFGFDNTINPLALAVISGVVILTTVVIVWQIENSSFQPSVLMINTLSVGIAGYIFAVAINTYYDIVDESDSDSY